MDVRWRIFPCSLPATVLAADVNKRDELTIRKRDGQIWRIKITFGFGISIRSHHWPM